MRHVNPDAGWENEDYTRPCPADPGSWRTGRSLEVLFVGIAVLLAALLVWSASTPSGELLVGAVALFGMLASGIVWLFLCVVSMARAFRGRPLPAPLALGPVPTVLVLAIVLSLTTLPVRARFAVGRGALEQYANRVADEAGAAAEVPISQIPLGSDEWDLLHPDPPGRLGSYPIDSVQVRAEGVYLMVEGGWSGFALLPDGSPATGVISGSYRSLGGDWYLFDASG